MCELSNLQFVCWANSQIGMRVAVCEYVHGARCSTRSSKIRFFFLCTFFYCSLPQKFLSLSFFLCWCWRWRQFITRSLVCEVRDWWLCLCLHHREHQPAIAHCWKWTNEQQGSRSHRVAILANEHHYTMMFSFCVFISFHSAAAKKKCIAILSLFAHSHKHTHIASFLSALLFVLFVCKAHGESRRHWTGNG